jgi:hypothetical protein
MAYCILTINSKGKTTTTPLPEGYDPNNKAYCRGVDHGMKPKHVYDPHYNYSPKDKDEYRKGFNDARDLRL